MVRRWIVGLAKLRMRRTVPEDSLSIMNFGHSRSQTPGMPTISLIAGNARGRKYTTKTPTIATNNPVSCHVSALNLRSKCQ